MFRVKFSRKTVNFQSIRAFMRTVTRSTTLASAREPDQDAASPLQHEDYFGVRNMATIKNLFNSRVHYGHKKGCRHHTMQPYIFGCRNGVDVIDLEETQEHLTRALNFLSHIVYRGGIVLFVMRSHIHGHLVELTAKECGEFALTRHYQRDIVLQRDPAHSANLPDVCVFLSLLDNVNTQHTLITDCAKVNIPTIGIADTNTDMSVVTYPVPGNDDSLPSIELYCKLFKTCIIKAKQKKDEPES